MEDKVFLRLFSGIMLSVFLCGIAHADDILFHEHIGEQAIIYRVSPDGTGLRVIGHGMFPQWSPDKKLISYVEAAPIFSRELLTTDLGQLIVANPEGAEIFRIKEVWKIGNVIRYCWNPKGKSIAFVTVFARHNGSVSIYDIETKRIQTLHKFACKDLDEAFIATKLEWSPDGEQLIFSPGFVLSKGQGIVLINPKRGTVKKLSDIGTLPRFPGKDRVLFVIGSEIWAINASGGNKRKLLDTGIPILNLSNTVNKKIILQTKPRDLPGALPFKLLLLDLENNRLEEIKAENYLLLCPRISPDGDKFTAVGLKLKNGELVSEEEAEPGYYVYDLKTKEVTLLKRFEPGKGEGFWFGVYLGYGNHTSWN